MSVAPSLLIGGEWISSTATQMPVVNPFTGEEIARVTMGGEPATERALAAAHVAFPEVRGTPAYQPAALLLAEVLVEAGVPAGQMNFVTCSNDDAAPLIADERVKKITFTGSPAVGWKLKARCGKKRITLELGGNAGVIVHADADLEAAIP